MNLGFLIRNDRCIGCHACTTACKSENDVPLGVDRTWVKSVEKGRHPDVRRTFQVTRCNHCAEPPCVEICPVTAMYRREDGIVEFDGDRCIGCRACLQACPYDAIHIDPASGTAAKCHFCAHRTDLGLEPACVVVCPEHAIVAGDLDDPRSEISRQLAAHDVTVRKPEQGTRPKLFYVDGDQAALVATAVDRWPESFAWADVVPAHGGPGARPGGADGRATGEGDAEGWARGSRADAPWEPGPIVIGGGRMADGMVRGVYNAQHRVPWHWPVPAYLVTKGIGAGLFLLLALGHLLGLFPFQTAEYLTVGILSLAFTGATTALLILDLERPERFLRILTRPQWRSWLTRGGYLLVLFTLVTAGWWIVEAGAAVGWWEVGVATSVRWWAFLVGAPTAAAVAFYSAFLFGQAVGRDLWQSTLLPGHLLVQSALSGAATFLVVAPFLEPSPELMRLATGAFVVALVADLLVVVMGELGMSHASDDAARAARAITRGRYGVWFWGGSMAVGHAAPLALLLEGAPWATALAGVMAIVGQYAWEHAFVMAPQDIPNS
ncbi:MAG: polysulfide reductase NrfD [Gemmatimonadota bacterium]|jgi:Fe-S-cluster-containing dehydrogenase component